MAKKLFSCLCCIDLVTASMSLTQLVLIWNTGDYPCYISNITNLIANISQVPQILVFCKISILCYLPLKKPLLHNRNCIVYQIVFLELICTIIYGFIIFFLIRQSLNARIFTIIQIGFVIFITLVIFCILLANIILFTITKKSYLTKTLSNNNQHQRNHLESASNLVQNQKDTISIDFNIQSESSHKRKKEAVKNLTLITIFHLTCNLALAFYMLSDLIRYFG